MRFLIIVGCSVWLKNVLDQMFERSTASSHDTQDDEYDTCMRAQLLMCTSDIVQKYTASLRWACSIQKYPVINCLCHILYSTTCKRDTTLDTRREETDLE